MKHTVHTINGLTCLFVPLGDANSVTVEIMVKAGSIYETRETNGLSHFLEHMFFKGGKKYTTPSEVAIAVERFGGEFNAYTADEYAGYYVKCAPEYLSKAADVLADMMVHPTFPLEEMEREKGVVLQEVAMYEDNPQRKALTKWRERYFGDTSYGWPILGPVENIQSFTQEQLFEHKNNLYTKDNLVVIVSGKMGNQEEVLNLMGTLFADLPATKQVEIPLYNEHTPSEKQASFKKDTEQNHLIVSCKGFDSDDSQRHAATVLGLILAGNMSSRMFQNIREKQGLCYYIGGGHNAETFDGYFYFRAGMDKGRFDLAVEKIYEECEKICTGDISQEEFDNAIGYKLGSLQMGLETTDGIAGFFGAQQLLHGKVETLEDKMEHYKKLTIEDVNAVKHLLNKENLYMYWVE